MERGQILSKFISKFVNRIVAHTERIAYKDLVYFIIILYTMSSILYSIHMHAYVLTRVCFNTRIGEMEVFIQEYGQKSCHSIMQPVSSAHLMEMLTTLSKALTRRYRIRTITVVIWGHGNKVDENNGYYKIFNERWDNFEMFFLNDFLEYLFRLSQDLELSVQVLMTQCWAHCHNQRKFENAPSLSVCWLTDHVNPETSARRWNSLNSGEEMSADELERFISTEENYNHMVNVTVKNYSQTERRIFLKYLHYSSIHVEATCFLAKQRSPG